MCLNFKGLPYKTTWLEYEEIEARIKPLGLDPNPPAFGIAAFTCPVVKLPGGRYVMDSTSIARELDLIKPEPPLNVDNGRTEEAVEASMSMFFGLCPNILPLFKDRLLKPAAAKYFDTTRKPLFGMTLDELKTSDKNGEQAWKAAVPGMLMIKKLLTENTRGPFINGSEATYADFTICAVFAFCERVDKSDTFERLLNFDPSFRELYQACGPWLERSEY